MEQDILYLGIIVVALVFGSIVYLPLSIEWWNKWKYNEEKKKLLEEAAIEKEKRITNLKAQLKQALEDIKYAEIIFRDQDKRIDELMEKNAQFEQGIKEMKEQTPEWYKERYLDFIKEIRENKIANSLLEQQVKKQKADIEALLKINRELQNKIEEDEGEELTKAKEIITILEERNSNYMKDNERLWGELRELRSKEKDKKAICN